MRIIISLGLALAVACWALVIGHQMGWTPLADPDSYAPLQATMFFAYLYAGLFASGVVAVAVGTLIKK